MPGASGEAKAVAALSKSSAALMLAVCRLAAAAL